MAGGILNSTWTAPATTEWKIFIFSLFDNFFSFEVYVVETTILIGIKTITEHMTIGLVIVPCNLYDISHVLGCVPLNYTQYSHMQNLNVKQSV